MLPSHTADSHSDNFVHRTINIPAFRTEVCCFMASDKKRVFQNPVRPLCRKCISPASRHPLFCNTLIHFIHILLSALPNPRKSWFPVYTGAFLSDTPLMYSYKETVTYCCTDSGISSFSADALMTKSTSYFSDSTFSLPTA